MHASVLHLPTGLFTWAKVCQGDASNTISPQAASACALRKKGGCWEIDHAELERLRLCPSAWPLPLSKAAVLKVQNAYEHLFLLGFGGGGELGWLQQQKPPAVKRRRKMAPSSPDIDLSEYTELELWHLALHVIQVADTKKSTTPTERMGDLQGTQRMVYNSIMGFVPHAGPSSASGAGAEGYHDLSPSTAMTQLGRWALPTSRRLNLALLVWLLQQQHGTGTWTQPQLEVPSKYQPATVALAPAPPTCERLDALAKTCAAAADGRTLPSTHCTVELWCQKTEGSHC